MGEEDQESSNKENVDYEALENEKQRYRTRFGLEYEPDNDENNMDIRQTYNSDDFGQTYNI